MGKTFTRFGAALATATMLAGVAGCEPPPTEQICLGLVIGQRANSASVDYPSTIDAIVPAAERLGVGSLIVATGVSGSAAGYYIYDVVVEDKDNSYDFKDHQLNARNKTIDAIKKARANTPQADLLGAIEATASALRPSKLACTIHVFDSGLQTAGAIRFQDNDLLGRQPETVVAKVPKTETLSGMTVSFHNLGLVAEPQPALDGVSRDNLAAIWEGVVINRGGRYERGEPPRGGVEPPKNLPEVTIVNLPPRVIVFPSIEPTCTPTSTTWELPSDSLFEAETDRLLDGASKILDPAVDVLRGHPNATVVLVGHTASVGKATSGKKVSMSRAVRVKAYLVSKGISESRITPTGVGDTQPKCEDWDPTTGRQIDPCATGERRVDFLVIGVALCKE